MYKMWVFNFMTSLLPTHWLWSHSWRLCFFVSLLMCIRIITIIWTHQYNLLAIESFLVQKLLNKPRNNPQSNPIRLPPFALSHRPLRDFLPPPLRVLNLDMRGRVTFMYIFLFNYSRQTIIVFVLLNVSPTHNQLLISYLIIQWRPLLLHLTLRPLDPSLYFS